MHLGRFVVHSFGRRLDPRVRCVRVGREQEWTRGARQGGAASEGKESTRLRVEPRDHGLTDPNESGGEVGLDSTIQRGIHCDRLGDAELIVVGEDVRIDGLHGFLLRVQELSW